MTKEKEKLKSYDLSDTYELGLDVENRTIRICDEMGDSFLSILNFGIDVLNHFSSEPISLNLSSFGGSVYHALGVYDLIKNSKAPVNILCTGFVMSAGIIILQAGDKKISFPNTTFMAHEVSSWNFGKFSDQEVEVKETKRLQDKIIEILSKSTKKDVKFWSRELKHTDKYYNAEKALELGLITEIKK